MRVLHNGRTDRPRQHRVSIAFRLNVRMRASVASARVDARLGSSLNCLSAECSNESIDSATLDGILAIEVSIAFRLNVRMRAPVIRAKNGELFTIQSQLPFG